VGTLTLVPEELFRGNGYSPSVPLSDLQGKPIQLTLSITRMMEEQTLEILIWGSTDGEQWMDRPLVTLPHRHYCGDYHYTMDLTRHPQVTHMRAEWRLRSWGHTTAYRLISFSLEASEAVEAVMAAGAH
jgi:hypothetical protein